MKKKIDVTTYKVQSEKISPKENVRIVFLSDFHSNSYKVDTDILFDKVKEAKPDVIICGGDMISKSPKDDISISAEFIARLCTLGVSVIHGMGNHESFIRVNDEAYLGRFKEYSEFLTQEGVTFLDDKGVTFQSELNKLVIYGLSLDYVFFSGGGIKPGSGLVSRHIGEAKKEDFVLLLAHNPNFYEQYCDWGADLTLSGHEHGGIMRGFITKKPILSTSKKLFPKRASGMIESPEYENKKMIVSRGLGMHTVNLRINNRPEVCIIELTGKQVK